MNSDKFLPIGSIVKLTGLPNELMIIGYMINVEIDNENHYRDYIACDSIKGFSEETAVFFNKKDIDNVIFMGYKDMGTIEQLRKIDKFSNRLNQEKDLRQVEALYFIDILHNKTNAKSLNNYKSVVKDEIK